MSRRRGGGGGGGGGHHGTRNSSNDFSVDQRKRRKPCSEEVLTVFGLFRAEIDERNDRWERIVKLSRDITIESKRVIFLLHRLSVLPEGDSDRQTEEIVREADERLSTLRKEKLKSIAQELKEEDPNFFLPPYRPGLQEYIEAASLLHYLKTDHLLTWSDVKESLRFDQGVPDGNQSHNECLYLEVPLIDYLCGIGDLTGELMRLAIGYVSAGNFRKPAEIRSFLAQLYRGFVLLGRGVNSKDFAFKLRVAKQNLEKVENACYMLNLRGTEVPEHMLAEVMTNLFAAPNNNDVTYGQPDLDQVDI